jgi:exopolysaccharide biosynthesis polyprenyl glycosylphosphotransferase
MLAGELRKQRALFAIADAGALVAAVAVALIIHDPSHGIRAQFENADLQTIIQGVVIATLLWLGVFRAFDLYRMRDGSRQEAITIIKASTVATGVLLLAAFGMHVQMSRVFVGMVYFLSISTVIGLRTVLRRMIQRFYSSPRIATALVIVGFDSVAHLVCDRFEKQASQYEVVGFLDSGSAGRKYRGYPVLGSPEQLAELQRVHPYLEAAIAMPNAPLEEQARMVTLCENARVQWWMVPWVYPLAPVGLRVDTVGMIPLVGTGRSNTEGLNYLIKRVFDIVCATILLAFVMPVIGSAALAIVIFDGFPILYRQQRVGARGRRFEMLKLRTMSSQAVDIVHRDFVQHWIGNNGNGAGGCKGELSGAGKTVFKMCDDPRITNIGRVLRRFSIDELPQLWNVIRGEMSLIGPRPALPYEVELYESWHRRRLEGMPGITGLWQVSGRHQLSFDAMVRLDLAYLQDWSLMSDVRILFQTIPVLFRGGGL